MTSEVCIVEKLCAKVAEQKERPHKSIIDWKSAVEENAKTASDMPLKNLQRAVKKFLKIGEIELAESIFEKIKLVFRVKQAV